MQLMAVAIRKGNEWMKATRFFSAMLLMVVVVLQFCPAALGEQNNYYIIEDSDARYLTEAELWDWQYEALGYIYNEFFARHGRAFRAGEKYDLYFRAQAWYEVNPKYRYGLLNKFEQANEKLVHQVLQEMRAQKTTNKAGRALPTTNEEAERNSVLNFRSYELKAGQKLEVFTGPGENYYRCANGKAGASTNEKVRIAGREKGWIAVEYETNGGSWRIGYTLERKLKDKLDLDELELYYDSGVIVENCAVTDEPDGSRTALATLSPGAEVTLLGPYTDGKNGDWAYVDVQTNAGLIRGFVPVSCVSGSPGELDFDSTYTDDGRYDWEDEADFEGEVG